MNDNGANTQRRIPFTHMMYRWIKNLNSEDTFWISFWITFFGTIVLIVSIVTVASNYDTFKNIDDRMRIITTTAENKIKEIHIKGKCWAESSESTPERIILYSLCDGNIKTKFPQKVIKFEIRQSLP